MPLSIRFIRSFEYQFSVVCSFAHQPETLSETMGATSTTRPRGLTQRRGLGHVNIQPFAAVELKSRVAINAHHRPRSRVVGGTEGEPNVLREDEGAEGQGKGTQRREEQARDRGVYQASPSGHAVSRGS